MKKKITLPLSLNRIKDSKMNWEIVEPFVKCLILIVGLGVLFFSLKEGVLFSKHPFRLGAIENLILNGIFFLSVFVFITSLIFRTYLWFRYQPFNSAKVEDWPAVTVVVPAYNEGETVYHTISSIVSCDYPPEKLKIVVINDGSKDNTHEHILAAKLKYPNRVEVINFPVNRGKRQALYSAYLKIKSAYMITIDSDTKLDVKAIKEILTPLILDAKIGAVTGRIKVWNKDVNVFTKMLNAHFAMAFDFTRAIQSTFYCVFCLSGAFSAYRVSVLNKVIDKWLIQKFMNVSCTYGEDRSLTNFVLREGYNSFFQRSAISFTIVPEKIIKILKMFTRWARSNIRESIVFSGFVISSNRKGNILLPFIDFSLTVSLVLLHFMWFYYFLFSGLIDSAFLFRILSYSVFFGFFYTLYFLRIEGRQDSPYIIFFSVFSSFFMIWIFTVAGFTLTKKGWSTR